MAAVVPEIIETANAAGSAAETTAAGPARAGARARAGGAAGPGLSRSRAGGSPRGGQQRERQFRQAAKRTGRGALKARLPGSHSYQPVVLAEFLVAVVVVSVSPVAKGGTATAQAKGSPSPYSVDTLKQLIAIGAVYFVLALLASSRRAGRMAAWFGGLVLLGLGFTQLANGDLTALFKIFAPGGSHSAGGGADALGSPLFAPGVPAADQQAAQDALNPPLTAQSPGPNVSLQDSGQTTTTNITFPGPGVITSDSGGQLALPDARLEVGEGREGHHRPQHRQLDGDVRPERLERAGHRVRGLQDRGDRRRADRHVRCVRRCAAVGHRRLCHQ
jgi:hypothetical protein